METWRGTYVEFTSDNERNKRGLGIITIVKARPGSKVNCPQEGWDTRELSGGNGRFGLGIFRKNSTGRRRVKKFAKKFKRPPRGSTSYTLLVGLNFW